MNPLRSMPLAVACTLVVCGCENSPSNNRGLDFEEIEVNFLATKEGSSWSDSDEVGLLAYCTRNELENTSMGGGFGKCPVSVGISRLDLSYGKKRGVFRHCAERRP